MAVRIRVYPQYGGMGMAGLGAYGYNRMGAVSANTYYSSRLQTQRQLATLQLGYERALANERIERARLEERMRNPYLQMGGLGGFGYSQMVNPYATSLLGASMLGTGSSFFGSLGLGGLF